MLTAPGPYLVEPINGGDLYSITTTQCTGFGVVAETPCQSDAYMMAASFDLATVLKTFIAWYDDQNGNTYRLDKIVEAARLAVAKAFEGHTLTCEQLAQTPSLSQMTWLDKSPGPDLLATLKLVSYTITDDGWLPDETLSAVETAITNAERIEFAKALHDQERTDHQGEAYPSEGLMTWPDFDDDGLPNGAVCIGQDGITMGVAFDTPNGPSGAATATLWSTAREAIEALSAMMIFDHCGLRGLILSSGRRHGWTQDDFEKQQAAITQAQLVITKVKGGGQ